jgi:hypothetical protein
MNKVREDAYYEECIAAAIQAWRHGGAQAFMTGGPTVLKAHQEALAACLRKRPDEFTDVCTETYKNKAFHVTWRTVAPTPPRQTWSYGFLDRTASWSEDE